MTDTPKRDLRNDLLHAIDFAYVTGVLGYGTPEELLAAYDASRAPADRAALRQRAEVALGAVEAALGDTLVSAAREEALAGIAAVLPEPTDRAAVYTSEDRCAECGHFRGAHEDPDEPVSVGRCIVCAEDEARHNYEPNLAAADNPTQLRWGLDDVLHGDDDTTTVLLSGPDGEPYWLELEPERAAALRDALAGPGDSAAKATALDVLRCLANPEPCAWEGVYCVTHSWKSDVGLCPHGQAQTLLGGGR